jgi:hypothetical protein
MSLVPEFDLPKTEASKTDLPPRPARVRSDEDSSVFEVTDSGAAAREGLPSNYRMRADRHYIDHMTSESVGSPVRMIPIAQIQNAPPAAAPGEMLATSIARHGILEPLLVRKRNGRYLLIAGRKRLAAAAAAGLTAVPCLVHAASDAEAAALSDAENVRGMAQSVAAALAAPIDLADVLQEVSAGLVRLDRSTALLQDSPGAIVFQRTALDLITAQTWRASWLARATAYVLGQRRSPGRKRSLPAVVERVLQGLEAEMRLSAVQAEANVLAAASAMVDEAASELVLSGALLTTLGWVQGTAQPVIELRGDVPNASEATVEIVQRSAIVPPDVVRDFSDTAGGARLPVGGCTTALLRAVAARSNGSLALATDDAGSVLRCTLRR